ncbi:hypothetical protein NQ314_003035 [Rhamnusium bicolor]|uniref:Uncharacterized protein n=1 Tax=Rhamnusium bicolor TaxID=1586634 RepID=A0AAV8ZRH8_9CUCU|nr:hypothetical protein NQ314_003035 [Rhamnusium bicolor]
MQVTSYAIVVAEDDSKNASGLEMPSWRDVQAYSVWPPTKLWSHIIHFIIVPLRTLPLELNRVILEKLVTVMDP